MILFIATIIINYLLTAIVVGITFFALFGHRIPMPPFKQKKSLLVLFCIFAFLDIYWIPAILSLDATITIGNKQIANSLGLKGEVSLGEMFGIGWFDVIAWIIQSIIAHFVGIRVYQKLLSRLISTKIG
jgi:hypothetical protein